MRISQKIRQLPSGSYTVQVQVNGRRKSITAKSKDEVERRAMEYALTRSDAPSAPLGVLMDKYITSKENVLSPSTIRGYKQIRKAYLSYLMDMPADSITSDVLQAAVNRLALDHSPKTVRNVYGLIVSTLKVFVPRLDLTVTLPKKRRLTYAIPTTSEVFALINAADEPLKTAILLAAFCGLRRSEIVALEASDLNGRTLHVHSAAVYDSAGETIIKQPKTYNSDRYVTVPDVVCAHIADKSGLLCPMALSTITRRFVALRESLGLSCRFHDLRHYYASFQHALGVPDAYIMESGGWQSDSILKSVYRNTLGDERSRNDEKINAFLRQSANEMQTERR